MTEDVLTALFRLLQVGFVAAFLQLIAEVLVTPFALVMMRHGTLMPLSTSTASDFTEPSIDIQSSIIAGTYLIISLGVALTENRFLDSAATQIRHMSHLKPFRQPNMVMALMLVQFCLGVAGFTMLALHQPQILIDCENQFGWGGTFIIAWPGIMSIGVACFGANAHAALRALQW
jgi:hypothetical protein